MTPETAIKQKLNRLDEKLRKESGLDYRRLTFGPYSTSGTPDRMTNFGSAKIWCEVKRDGKKPTKLQQHKLDQAVKFGEPAIWTAGAAGVSQYYEQMATVFERETVEERIAQYAVDCSLLHEALKRVMK